MIKIPSFEKEKYTALIIFLHKKTRCIMLRNVYSGSWCGYIRLDKDHPWTNDSYDDINYKLQREDKQVHGTLTFKGAVDLSDLINSKDDSVFIGFDCAHIFDIKPICTPIELKILTRILEEEPDDQHPTYKDISYVMNECRQLADWMLEANETANDQ